MRHRDAEGRGNGETEESNVSTNKGTLGATSSWKARQDPSLEPSERSWPTDTLISDF